MASVKSVLLGYALFASFQASNSHPNDRPVIIRDYDYVVVGSGPGAAPLAARLGLAGHRVLVIEAGIDIAATDYNATVPLLNGKASEDPKMAWDFFVSHYDTEEQNARDAKYYTTGPNGTLQLGVSPGSIPQGFLYPRTAAVGGCVNHNALIMMYPVDEDWWQIANSTNDPSWAPQRMREHWHKMENCQYLSKGSPYHGFDGWMSINRAEEQIFFRDDQCYDMVKAAAELGGQSIISKQDLVNKLQGDMNAPSPANLGGLYNTPLNMDQYKRSSPRDFLVDTAQMLAKKGDGKGKIDIRINCLATKIIFQKGTTRAIGVEFLDGQSLYRADPRSQGSGSGSKGIAYIKKEVIVAGGTFNTPQLLKLSGIGPAEELRSLGIPVVVDLPGVGENLQDRYENSVVVNLNKPFTVWQNCTFGSDANDPCLQEWKMLQSNASRYSTNGRPVSIPRRSKAALGSENDLIISGRPGYFAGYFHGYSTIGARFPNSWTWPVLKARTQNRGGVVKLRTVDPRDVPEINFRYFDAGSGNWQYDLAAVVEGLQYARSIIKRYAENTGTTVTELVPGPDYQTAEQLAKWARDSSWGHHACCTAKIGSKDDPMAVLDSKFKVRGTRGLRVVDASVFPKIPGYYVQLPVMMVSEKAASDILNN
ncbi:hypothetical protein EKO04_008264 [Ascochyta lentis]|uniref:Glucose-methanol-choline oxidoreductase N-terminal domain-containing protein n=1 Tax=Ascochyta lentis TaxID=205686 RepID=A0A8H7MGB0_9PLEO|nr:hypothetical protein EKO04_008264 [Ascochyta lentis]